MNTIEVNGETLAYERAGQGPVLVLVHSLGTGAWLWREQIARWKADFDVIAFDTRGHGGSTNNGGFTVKAVAKDIATALDKLGVSRAHLLGISMGGLICARIHELAPERVASLVIADSFPTLGEAGPQRVAVLEDTIGALTIAEYGEQYARETILPATPAAHGDELAASIAAMEKENYLQTVRSIFTEDVVECLKAVRVPSLVVVGEKDQRTPPAANEKIAGLLEGSEYHVIPDAAHLANLDNPAGFHAVVDPFLMQRKSG